MRRDRDGFVLCNYVQCKEHARYRAVTEGRVIPLCVNHRRMLDMEGVPTERMSFMRQTLDLGAREELQRCQ